MEWRIAYLLAALLIASATAYPLFSISGSRRVPTGDDNSVYQRIGQTFRFYGRSYTTIRVSRLCNIITCMFYFNVNPLKIAVGFGMKLNPIPGKMNINAEPDLYLHHTIMCVTFANCRSTTMVTSPWVVESPAAIRRDPSRSEGLPWSLPTGLMWTQGEREACTIRVQPLPVTWTAPLGSLVLPTVPASVRTGSTLLPGIVWVPTIGAGVRWVSCFTVM